jgi:hypothetical protein
MYLDGDLYLVLKQHIGRMNIKIENELFETWVY